MRLLAFVSVVMGLLGGCEGDGPEGASFIPNAKPSTSRDASAADAGDNTPGRVIANRGGTKVGGRADSGTPPEAETDAGAPAEVTFSGATMLVQITDDKRRKCALHAVSPTAISRTALFDCERRNHVFRRSDGRHFFVANNTVYSVDGGGVTEPVPTECNVVGAVDFDAENRMLYRCIGGTTGDLYRDDQLIASNVVAELGGVFDNGQIFYHGFEEYRVLDPDGVELTKYETPSGWVALEDATTISGDTAYMLWVDRTDSEKPLYVVMTYDGAGFEVLRTIKPEEPPPGNYGTGLRLDPSGALYVVLEGKVRRYDPDGTSKIVWTNGTDTSVDLLDELVYFPGVK